MHGMAGFIDGKVGGDTGQGNRMAERDQLAGALGGLDGSDAGYAEDIALLRRAVANQRQCFGFHEDAAGGTGAARGLALGADIDHVGLAGTVEMGQILLGHGVLQEVTLCLQSAVSRLSYHNTMPFAQRLLAGLLACSLVVQPLRADSLPELGDVASNELSLNTEKRIGRQIMNEIRLREPAYLDDADVEGYLNVLGGKLVAASDEPGIGFFFFAIADQSINAFAMPGGFIGVHTGLIISAQTESELAGVMAHEIAHVTQRHIARQVFQSKQLGMASMLAMGLALLAARSSSQAASAAIATTQAGAISAQLAFSRDFERESDRLGFDILRKAGFDVRGMAAFFDRLQRSARHYENNATAYLRTHPLTGERLTDMQNREGEVAYRQVPDSIEFHLVRAKLRAMQGTPAEAVRHFETLLGEGKFASEAAARYGLAYALFRARDWAAAERQLQPLRSGKPEVPMLERLQAELRIAQGDPASGLAIYREALKRFPLNEGLLDGYGQALLGARRFAEALRFADEQLQARPEQVRFLRLRAAGHAGLGQMAQQHQALAEVFALHGQTGAAIEQLEQAQKAGDANFYVMSAIDARLRELKRLRLEELKERRN